MKTALIKDGIKEIKISIKRFISLLLIVLLGVGFFAGIKAASPDMRTTLDTYFDELDIMDIQVISTMGLTDDDVTAIKNVENVKTVEGAYQADAIVSIGDEDVVVKMETITNDLNKLKLVEGKMPENEKECVVESNFLTQNNKKIGDTIEVVIEDTQNSEGEDVNYLKEKQMKIVGTIKSPMYISKDRGSSSLGAGKVNYYIYINENNINAKDVFTNIYVKVKGANELETSSNDYKELISNVKDNIENIKDKREKARQDELINTATDKLNDAEKEFNDKKKEAEDEIAKAEKEIEDGNKKIEDGQKEITDNEKKANEEFENAEKQIEDAKNTIKEQENILNEKEAEANKQFEEYEKQKEELNVKLSGVQSLLDITNEAYAGILEALKDPDIDDNTLESLLGQKLAKEAQIKNLEDSKNALVSAITKIDNGISFLSKLSTNVFSDKSS